MAAANTYPIALACGFSRFDELLPWHRLDRPGHDDFHYFKKIQSTLHGAGYAAFHTHVSWGAPLQKRAHELAHRLSDEVPGIRDTTATSQVEANPATPQNAPGPKV